MHFIIIFSFVPAHMTRVHLPAQILVAEFDLFSANFLLKVALVLALNMPSQILGLLAFPRNFLGGQTQKSPSGSPLNVLAKFVLQYKYTFQVQKRLLLFTKLMHTKIQFYHSPPL